MKRLCTGAAIALLSACEPAYAIEATVQAQSSTITGIQLWQFAQSIGVGVALIYTWVSHRTAASIDEIRATDQRLTRQINDHGTRLTRLEQLLENAPTHRDLAEARAATAKLSAQMDAMTASLGEMRQSIESGLRPVSRLTDMLMQHQLDLGGAAPAPRATRTRAGK